MNRMWIRLALYGLLVSIIVTGIGGVCSKSKHHAPPTGSSGPPPAVWDAWQQDTFDSGSFNDTVTTTGAAEIILSSSSSSLTATKLSATLPTARASTSACWDPLNNCAYVFGGSPNTDEIVKWDPGLGTATVVSLTYPSAVLPTARQKTSAVWDPVNNVAYIFGGLPTTDEIVRFDPASTTPVSVISDTIPSAVLPSARYGTSAVWDPVNDCAYVFGGNPLTDEIVKFDPAAVPAVTVLSDTYSTAILPSARQYHSAVWDPVNNVAYIFGGQDSGSKLDEIVRFDPAWTPAVTTFIIPLPSARTNSSAVWDPLNNCAYIFDGSPATAEIVRLDPASQTVFPNFASLPSARYYTSAVWDPGNECAYVFGGSGSLNDIVKVYTYYPYTTPGTYISPVISPTSVSKWGIFSATYTAPTNTKLLFEVLDPSDTFITWIVYGGDLDAEGVKAEDYPAIKLKAIFETSDDTLTPTLFDWRVYYKE